jgi:hypothetical protein
VWISSHSIPEALRHRLAGTYRSETRPQRPQKDRKLGPTQAPYEGSLHSLFLPAREGATKVEVPVSRASRPEIPSKTAGWGANPREQ